VLTRLHELVSSRVAARPFVAFRTVIGAVAVLKGIQLIFRFTGQAELPHRTWLSWSPDVLGPVMGSIVLLAWLAAAVALTVGIRPRLAASVLALLSGLLVLDSRLYNQHLYLLGLVCLLVALAGVWPDGRARARGSERGRERGRERVGGAESTVDESTPDESTVDAWPLFLLRLQTSLVYAFGAVAKLSADFVTGRVLYSVLVGQPIAGLLGSLTTEPRFLVSISVAAVAAELFLAVAPWIPRARGLLLAVAGPFHLGMLVMLPPDLVGFVALLVFGLLQLSVLLFLFAPAERLLVVWDDRCSFCSRWVALFVRLDWLGHVELLPLSRPDAYARYGITQDAALEALQLRAADGSVHGGFEAVRRVAYALPLTMLLAPWLALPPVRWLGGAVYRRTARRRLCRVGSGKLAPGGLPGAGG
jgi:predicted DCC family thiol-disulfide oxidoreductase YuxK